MAWKLIAGFGVAIVLSVCVVLAEKPDKEGAAISAAETGLSLVDEGKYSYGWNEAAGYFRGAVREERWQETLQGVRMPLGKVISRQVKVL